MADKETQEERNKRYNSVTGEYGEFTGLVALTKENFSQEATDVLQKMTPPLYITPYNKWTAQDIVKIHNLFPNVYHGFVGMFNAVASKNVKDMTPVEKQDAQDAIKAMTVLSSDGDWKSFAKMLHEAGTEIQAQTNQAKKTSSVSDSLISNLAKTSLAINGVKLDVNHDLVTPNPMAKAAEIMAAMTTKLQQRAA